MADADTTPAPTTIPDNPSEWSPVWTTAALAAAQVIDFSTDLNSQFNRGRARDFLARFCLFWSKPNGHRARLSHVHMKNSDGPGLQSRPSQTIPPPIVNGRHAAAAHDWTRRGTNRRINHQLVDPTAGVILVGSPPRNGEAARSLCRLMTAGFVMRALCSRDWLCMPYSSAGESRRTSEGYIR